MTLSVRSLTSQINYAKETLLLIDDRNLRNAYLERTQELELELKKWRGRSHKRAKNYAIVVQRLY